MDASWGSAGQGKGSGAPESYLSNARTNEQWTASLAALNDQGQGLGLGLGLVRV